MTDLRQLRKEFTELCNRKDAAEREYNSLHRQAKHLKQEVIVPMENELVQLENEIKRMQKQVV